ncbi:MAG: alpha-N-arabinofuranosidase [Rikenellaceae bacterium]|nr:alpha-N-arabinofuranosidase [Rikenellaceae bacterium]
MNIRSLLPALMLGFSADLSAQSTLLLTVHADRGEHTISRHIYGHFAEHLGRGIYGGIWVGEDSSIPHIDGVRKDIVEALKQIKIPNLRWPGGCSADEYHWMDGIGPREQPPKMINTHWGGVTEDNSFGTHEFLNLCEWLETEPYICSNVGSGTVEEMSKWVEYITFEGESPMANLRRQNGRQEPWKVKYWGVGNENWGCGGNMTAEYYAGEYRRYNTYARNYGENRLFRIVGGPNVDDYHWMEVMMKNIPTGQKNGVSLHYYTYPGDTWGKWGSAIDFDETDYYRTIARTFYMEELVSKHSAIMDRYDPQKRVKLIVDEWGAWYDPHPGSVIGFLEQQNTMRDAIVAAVNLNIFNNHCDRVHMANIAQLVNVLQALFLTNEEKMIRTPTYHVFDMYQVHHDAVLLPVTMPVKMLADDRGMTFPQVSASASKNAEGKIHLSLVNTDLSETIALTCSLEGTSGFTGEMGQIILAKNIQDYNSFDQPNQVVMYEFTDFQMEDGLLTVNLPAASIVTIALK